MESRRAKEEPNALRGTFTCDHEATVILRLSDGGPEDRVDVSGSVWKRRKLSKHVEDEVAQDVADVSKAALHGCHVIVENRVLEVACEGHQFCCGGARGHLIRTKRRCLPTNGNHKARILPLNHTACLVFW
jgi:hypothetical protein